MSHSSITYIPQNDDHNCAPIMIANLLRWAGFSSITEKDIPFIAKQLKTKKTGTTDPDTDYFLRNKIKNIRVNKYRYPKDTYLLRKSVQQRDKVAIISHHFNKTEYKTYNGDGHIFLCVDYTPGFFTVVNYWSGQNQATLKTPTREMYRLLKRRGTKVWIAHRQS